MGRVLVVDGANVVGSRPDGWWRDRPGAAARLHAQLSAVDWEFDELVLVLEGKARGGVPSGVAGGIRTVHAPADGDTTIADLTADLTVAGEVVTVVTADRGLSSRVADAGGRLRRPSWLLDRLTQN